MGWRLVQYLSHPAVSSRQAKKHIRNIVLEPHRLRAWWFYATHPRYPLFTPAATHFLEEYLTSGMRVFEWGAGRSTLFFARHKVHVVTIEDNAEWHQKITRALSVQGFRSAEVKFLPEEKAYIQASQVYPDNYFDVVAVDGRERAACLYAALTKVKPGGLILLDDSQRERYQAVIREVEKLGWHPTHFPFGFNRTTLWQKPL